MAVVPISGGSFTLSASAYLTSMTALINDLRIRENLQTTSTMNKVMESCYVGKVDFGRGIIYEALLGPQDVENLSTTSTALRIRKPAVAEEAILIEDFKVIELSTSEVLGHDAVPNGDVLNRFLEGVKKVLTYTKDRYIYGVCVALFNTWTPVGTNQTLTITLTDETGLTGDTLRKTKEANAMLISEAIRKEINKLTVPQNGYTDVATYTDPNDGTTKNVETCLDIDNIKLFMSDDYWTPYLSTTASLYHDDKTNEMYPNKKVVLPSGVLTGATTIGYIAYEKKFAYADFYNLTMSFADPSTLYNNIFLHFAMGSGVFQYAPGIKIVANYV